MSNEKMPPIPPHIMEQLKRPIAEFVIRYNPNDGAISYGSKGFLPVEEVGILTWVLGLRQKDFYKANENKIAVVPANAVPQ